MDEQKFNEVIDFAVAREEAAVAFYQSLQEQAQFQAQEDMLKEFEQMERGHIEILNNIRQRQGITAEDIPEVQDLMISDYLVEGELTDSLNYQDIIILAMKREEKSHNLYTHLAERVSDGDLKNLFLKLASEEAKHKLHFEKVYDDDVLKEN